MSFIVFLGPSVDIASAREVLDAKYLPPASQGDIYLAAKEKPWGIGLIDGYFKDVPAVWHKEILWALSHGVHVFGASSMGALRAAELAAFGMQGVGDIFNAYINGEIENDDEVCIVHSDAQSGYINLSDALVNIRATLTAALNECVIGKAAYDRMLNTAINTFYPRRNFSSLIRASRASLASDTELDNFNAWLPEGKVNQKRLDALTLLNYMKDAKNKSQEPMKVKFQFQHTDAWEQVRRQFHLKTLSDQPSAYGQLGDAVLSELRLDGQEYKKVKDEAFLHALCYELAESTGEKVDNALLPNALNNFRLDHDLIDPGSVEPWIENQQLDLAQLGKMLKDEILVDRIRTLMDSESERIMIDKLRLDGKFSELKSRGESKQRYLAARGDQNPDLNSVGITSEELWRWYFDELQNSNGRHKPDDQAKELGISVEELRREALREWLYQRQSLSDDY